MARPAAAVLAIAALAIMTAVMTRALLMRLVAAGPVDNLIFGADVRQIHQSAVTGDHGALGWDKHPLAEIVYGGLLRVQDGLGVPPDVGVVNAHALVAGALAASAACLFLRLSGSFVGGLACALLLMASNAMAIQTAVFESYTLTALASVAALILFWEMRPLLARRPIACSVFAGCVGGGVGLANTPAAAWTIVFGCIAFAALHDAPWRRRAVLSFGVPCLIAIAIALTPTIAKDMFYEERAPLSWAGDYVGRWASARNFTDAGLMSDYLASALVLNWVSTGIEPLCRYVADDLARAAARPLNLVGALGVGALLAATAVAAVMARRRGAIVLGASAVGVVLLLFHAYFNPWEAVLYASQWTLAVVVIIAATVARRAWGAGLVAVVGVLLLAANTPARWSLPPAPAAACGPERAPAAPRFDAGSPGAPTISQGRQTI